VILNLTFLMILYATIRFALKTSDTKSMIRSAWDGLFYIVAVLLIILKAEWALRMFAGFGILMILFKERSGDKALHWKLVEDGLIFVTLMATMIGFSSAAWIFAGLLVIFYSLRFPMQQEVVFKESPIEALIAPLKACNAVERELLSGMREGSFAINRSLCFEGLISDQAKVLFPNCVEGSAVSEVLFPEDDGEARKFKAALAHFFQADEAMSRVLAIELLPKAIENESYCYALHYTASDDGDRLYVFIEDRTERRMLDRSLEDREKQLYMIGEVMKNQNEFSDLRQSFDRFASDEPELHFAQTMDFNLLFNEVLHELHQFSVEFETYGLFRTSARLTELGQNLIRIKNQGDLDDLPTLKEWLRTFELAHVADDDIGILKRYIPDHLIDSKAVFVRQEVIAEIEERTMELPISRQRDSLLECIWKIKYIEVGKLLEQYNQYAQMLARRYGKKVNPIVFSGKNLKVDEERFKKLLHSVDQLISNSIEYGIEPPRERFRMGKKEAGTISIDLKVDEKVIEIEYQDDGRGIDINALKESLYENRYKNFDALVEMSDQEVLNCIFNEGVTTLKKAQHTGDGLYHLKQFINGFGGEISVFSEVNCYTRFVLTVPNQNSDEQEKK